MKRLLLAIAGLCLMLAGLTFGARLIGEHLIEWPIKVSYRQPMPDSPPFDSVLPEQIGDFQREQFSSPIDASGLNQRLTAQGAAEYKRAGDPYRIFIQVQQYASLDAAALLIDPTNWRLQGATTSKYYSLKSPTPYVLTETSNGYQDYTLEYVNGRWNVKIECTNDQSLLAFANLYPH